MAFHNHLENFRVCFRSIRIERDHLTTRVAFKQRQHDLRADLYRLADELILGEALHCREIDIDVRPEATLVDGGADFFA